MALPTQFTGNITPTGEQLDGDLAALGSLTPIPCTNSGTNALMLTPLSNTPTVVALTNYMQFTAIVAATNTGAVTAAVAGFAALNVYKDTYAGPVVLTGGELVANTKLILMYDAALNTGTGGYHVISPAWPQSRINKTTASITFPSLGPQTGATSVITLAGTSVGDIVSLGYYVTPSIGLVWNAYVPFAGSVAVTVFNSFTVASVTPTAGTISFLAQGFT